MGGEERPDAWLVEELGGELLGERLDLAGELAFLADQLLDTARDRAECEQASTELGVAAAPGPARGEALQEPRACCSGRNSARSGSGVVISRSRSWQRLARFALTAPSRAATSACSACRWPPARGVAGRGSASTLRAARIASSASVLPPERRSRRRPGRPRIPARLDYRGSGPVPARTSRCLRPRTRDGQRCAHRRG